MMTGTVFSGVMPGTVMTAYAEGSSVTWNSSTLSGINIDKGESFTNDGVTLKALNGSIDLSWWLGNLPDASFKFSTSSGNFTRIEITGNIFNLGGSGWEKISPGGVWRGNANETTFGGAFTNVTQIVFTIAKSTVDVTGVSLDKTDEQTINVDGTVSLTATVSPDNATDKTVKWSVGGTKADAVTLYSDQSCTTEVGTDATSILTVYAKGISAGTATVTATSNADDTKSASCNVTVNKKTYTVSYNSNDGSGTMADQTFEADTEQALSTNVFTRDDYTFNGWNTSADGTGTSYSDKESITVTEDMTLYAQWKEVEKHTHTLEKVDAVAATCTTDGNKAYYKCDGCDKWFEDASGSVEITDKSSVIIKATGHDWDEGEVTTEPTTTSEGIRTYTCKNDIRQTKTESSPKKESSSGGDSSGGGSSSGGTSSSSSSSSSLPIKSQGLF